MASGPEPTPDARPVPDTGTPRHHGGVATLCFADVAGSTALKQSLGDHAGIARLQQHHELVRHLVASFPGAEECFAAGDSFLLLFPTPSEAVRFAVLLQARLREFNKGQATPVLDRIGLHLGEVMIEEKAPGVRDVHGIQVDACSRVMSLAQAGQILLTRPVFDNARLSLKGESIEGSGRLSWLNHGHFILQGLEEPIEICEVRPADSPHLSPPTGSAKARRVAQEPESVPGWRPAVGLPVPNTSWMLERNLGEGGFGEVWLAHHPKLGERRVFKFCFRADRARSLRREVALFRILRERVGDHPHIVRVLEVSLDDPPYYVVMEHLAGLSLPDWCAEQGNASAVPLETKLEIVAQIAEALQAAHQAGVIHRDVKPANILVASHGAPAHPSTTAGAYPVLAKLTDFGIGQVLADEQHLHGTRAGLSAAETGAHPSPTGTQLYLAPELLAGRPASTRSDIYSLGVVLFQFLIGDFRRPVTTDWEGVVADPVLREDLRLCFAGDPDRRFAGAAQFAAHLRAWASRHAERRARESQAAERERLTRRIAQRHRLLVVTGSATLALAAIAIALAYGLRQAEVARRHANAEREHQRLHAYASDMKAAQVALEENNPGTAVALLTRHVPAGNDTDLRGFEWRFLWQQTRGDELRLFPHPAMVHSAVLSTDARILATTAQDRQLRLWDTGSGRLLRTLPANVPPTGISRSLAWGGPENSFWAAGPDGILRLANPDDAPEAFLPNGQPPLAAAPGSPWIVTANRRGIDLILANLTDGSVRDIPASSTFANALAVSPDGRWIACRARESTALKLVQTRDGTSHPLDHLARITAFAFSPDSQYLAVGDWEGEVMVWRVPGTRLELVCRMRAHQGLVFGLAFSPDRRFLATGGNDQIIHLWQTATTNRLGSLRGHTSEIWDLEFSGDGQRLASASKDGSARLWTAAPPPPSETSILPPDRLDLQGFTPDGEALVGWNQDDGEIVLLPSTPATPPQRRPLAGWDSSRKIQLRAFPEDHIAAGTDLHGGLSLWDLESGRILHTTTVPGGPISPVCLSANRQRLLALRPDRGGVLIDVERGTRLAEIPDLTLNYSSIAMSPDNRWLAYASSNYTIRLASLHDGRPAQTLSGHAWLILTLRFSPDSRCLASGSTDSTIRLWSVPEGQSLGSPWTGHQSGVGCLVFSADGRTLVSDADDRTVRWWSVPSHQEMLVQRDASIRRLFSVSPKAVWAPGGDRAVRVDRDGRVLVSRVAPLP